MSASFYELLKYAKTGIASPDMTEYDKMRAIAMAGAKYPIQTITGVPPIRFRSDGSPLDNVTIIGNGKQTGTPTPDAPIMPTFCGVRTGNLFDISTVTLGKYINAQGAETDSTAQTPVQALNHTDYIEIQPNTDYTYHYKFRYGIANTIALCWFDASKSLISRNTKDIFATYKEYTLTGTSPANAAFCIINFAGYLPNESMELSFNSGSTALPYEPYGYKILITNAGQTTPLYLGEVSTVRRVKKYEFTGNENGTIYHTVSSRNGIEIDGIPGIIGGTANITILAICTHYKPYARIDMYRSTDTGMSNSYNDNNIIFYDANYQTVEAFQQFCAQQYINGTPVTIWYALADPETGIVNAPLSKIGDYADELNSADAGVSIPTAKGANTLTVDTELQPSSVSITGYIK